MPEFTPHGGECCGITHILGFHTGTYLLAETLRCIDDGIDSELEEQREMLEDNGEDPRKANRLFEIVLTDQQCQTSPELLAGLKERKFRHKARWYNSNSGNYCNQFTLYKQARVKRPFNY